jgi:hypothetical protein
MEKTRTFVEAKNQQGNFKIVSDILDTLTLPETWVLWQKDATEYIFFSEEKWNRFANEMKKASWMTPVQLEYTKKWRNFMRELWGKWAPVTTKEHMLHIDRGTLMRKKIPEEICHIEICI